MLDLHGAQVLPSVPAMRLLAPLQTCNDWSGKRTP